VIGADRRVAGAELRQQLLVERRDQELGAGVGRTGAVAPSPFGPGVPPYLDPVNPDQYLDREPMHIDAHRYEPMQADAPWDLRA
jgi:hypothetical protein